MNRSGWKSKFAGANSSPSGARQQATPGSSRPDGRPTVSGKGKVKVGAQVGGKGIGSRGIGKGGAKRHRYAFCFTLSFVQW